jgi:decaprenylphospho-beta-D-erythro-pentofuranosid-2-ulose 2-reductase
VLLVGGTSDIGLAIAVRLVADGTRTVVLAGRRTEPAVDERLRSAGASRIEHLHLDIGDRASGVGLIAAAAALVGDLDLVIDAVGVLGGGVRAGKLPADAAAVVDAVFADHVGLLIAAAERLRTQGSGTLLVISSFAATRPRPSLFAYSAAKSGLDAFARGLGDALRGSGARVMVVRPGFVATSMTAGLRPTPFATTAEHVAELAVDGLRRRRPLVWAPAALRLVALLVRALPAPIWVKLDRCSATRVGRNR